MWTENNHDCSGESVFKSFSTNRLNMLEPSQHFDSDTTSSMSSTEQPYLATADEAPIDDISPTIYAEETLSVTNTSFIMEDYPHATRLNDTSDTEMVLSADDKDVNINDFLSLLDLQMKPGGSSKIDDIPFVPSNAKESRQVLPIFM